MRRPSRVGPYANSSAMSASHSVEISRQFENSPGEASTSPNHKTCSKSSTCWSFSGCKREPPTPNPTSNQQSSATSNTSCLNSAKASSLRHGRSASPSRKNTSSSTDSYGCYVLVDLKLGKLTHQDLGQMQMYVNYFARFVKTKAENSTVGIVLCKTSIPRLSRLPCPETPTFMLASISFTCPAKKSYSKSLTTPQLCMLS